MFYLHYENEWISWHKRNIRRLHIITMQKVDGLCLKFNYNFIHDVLKKIGLDLNLLQETAGLERWQLEKIRKDHKGSG